MVKIAEQKSGKRYAALALAEVAKAMTDAWCKLKADNNLDIHVQQVLVSFASDTTDEVDVCDHHAIVLLDPFDSPIIMTGAYGGYDFGAQQLVDTLDALAYGTDWMDDYPGLTRNELVLYKALEKLIWDEWKDNDGRLWCEVDGCIESYIATIPEAEMK